jgi:hypothetical protein
MWTNQGSAQLRWTRGTGRSVDLVVSTVQMCILLMFNSYQKLSLAQIRSALTPPPDTSSSASSIAAAPGGPSAHASLDPLINAALLSLTAERHPILSGPTPQVSSAALHGVSGAEFMGVYKSSDVFVVNEAGFANKKSGAVVYVHRVRVAGVDSRANETGSVLHSSSFLFPLPIPHNRSGRSCSEFNWRRSLIDAAVVKAVKAVCTFLPPLHLL